VDLAQVLEATVNFNLSGSNVRAVFSLPDDLWQVKADRGQISQVIANLTINARQAMPGGGNLYFEAENVRDPKDDATRNLSGSYVSLTIRDEGVGISSKHIDKVFDPYFSTKQTGSGLGLATVHSIIAKHQGHVSVHSTPEVGTTFRIYLPAYETGDTSRKIANAESDARLDTPTGHILVVDDEEMVRDTARAMLEESGYHVDSATEGREAIEKYVAEKEHGTPFDIVIMDLTIPGGMGGREAVAELLKIDPEARVVVASGYSTDPVLAEYEEYGFVGRLVKPFQMEDLARELSRIGNSK